MIPFANPELEFVVLGRRSHGWYMETVQFMADNPMLRACRDWRSMRDAGPKEVLDDLVCRLASGVERSFPAGLLSEQDWLREPLSDGSVVTMTSGAVTLGRRESTSMAAVKRPPNGPPDRSTFRISGGVRLEPGDGLVSAAASMCDPVFETFVEGLRQVEPVAGWVTFRDGTERHFEDINRYDGRDVGAPPYTAGYRWGLFVPWGDVERLGGLDAVCERAPVEEIVEVVPHGSSDVVGLAMRVRRDVTALDDEVLRQWREFLLPVLDLAVPTERSPWGWRSPWHEEEVRRPIDVLEQDWAPTDAEGSNG